MNMLRHTHNVLLVLLGSHLFATVHCTLVLRYRKPVKALEFESTSGRSINVWEHEQPEPNHFLLGQYITDEAVYEDEPPLETFVAFTDEDELAEPTGFRTLLSSVPNMYRLVCPAQFQPLGDIFFGNYTETEWENIQSTITVQFDDVNELTKQYRCVTAELINETLMAEPAVVAFGNRRFHYIAPSTTSYNPYFKTRSLGQSETMTNALISQLIIIDYPQQETTQGTTTTAPSPTTTPTVPPRNNQIIIIVAVTVPVVVLLLVIIAVLLYVVTRKQQKPGNNNNQYSKNPLDVPPPAIYQTPTNPPVDEIYEEIDDIVIVAQANETKNHAYEMPVDKASDVSSYDEVRDVKPTKVEGSTASESYDEVRGLKPTNDGYDNKTFVGNENPKREREERSNELYVMTVVGGEEKKREKSEKVNVLYSSHEDLLHALQDEQDKEDMTDGNQRESMNEEHENQKENQEEMNESENDIDSVEA